ncbi:hypothetical protein SLA2020_189290 [Shorea laevis]
MNESIRPFEMLSLVEVDGDRANNNTRPTKQATTETGDRILSSKEVDGNVETTGPTQLWNNKAIKGSLIQKIPEEERDRAALTDLHAAVEEFAFWKGFEGESGYEQEWMGRRQRKPKRSKKKKFRSCSSVYKEEGKENQEIKPDKRKRVYKVQGMKETMPIFSPGSQNQVAGESVTDSGIEIRNGNLRRDPELCTAERIWAFTKKIGVGV